MYNICNVCNLSTVMYVTCVECVIHIHSIYDGECNVHLIKPYQYIPVECPIMLCSVSLSVMSCKLYKQHSQVFYVHVHVTHAAYATLLHFHTLTSMSYETLSTTVIDKAQRCTYNITHQEKKRKKFNVYIKLIFN